MTNAFEQGLARAQARHRRFLIFAVAALLLAAGVMAAILLSANGTSIKIQPADARETGSVEVTRGFAFMLENILYGLSSSPSIVVRAPGFREKSLTLTPEQQGGTIEVTLVELPGQLFATTEPEHANTRWSLNGDIYAVGAALEQELEPGLYKLRADNPFFQPHEQEIRVVRAQEHKITIPLTAVEGTLNLASVPEGARITLNGENAGQTPVDLQRPGGMYKIAIEKAGFLSETETVALTHDKPKVVRNYRLAPVTATLSFTVAPKGGQLLLNGRQIDPSRKVSVSANRIHRVTYSRAGYRTVSQKVTLKARESRRITIRLQAALGEVEIIAKPDAEILVNGKKVGQGSVVLSLTAVPHKIELRKPGYRSVRKTLRPSVGSKTLVRETLVPEATARLQEALRRYSNSVGIELLLFQPGRFVMGAPRHQQGQRANEFLKEVVLKKAFYAAKHEVTNAQYGRYRKGHSGRANEPVVSVSWTEAASFCNWLSKQEGFAPFYRIVNGRLAAVNHEADGYRLLSEAEWEWLARKSGKGSQTVFPWGNKNVVPPKAGNIADESANGVTPFYVANYTDGYAKLAPVGKFGAEASGLYDLTGNVSEWVHDFYSLSPPEAQSLHVDPLGPSFGESHVIKGASWRSGTRTLLRAAYRDGLIDRRDDVGFRIGRYLYGGSSAAKN